MTFMLVTAAREESWISVVIEPHEWEKLQPLAFALRDQDATWTAQPHAGQSHRSQSVPSDAPAETEPGGVGIAARVDEHAEPTSPESLGVEDLPRRLVVPEKAEDTA